MTAIEPVSEKDNLISNSSDHGTDSSIESGSELDEKRDKTPVDQPALSLRFHEPPPSPFKRAALIVFTLLLFWLALTMRQSLWKNNHEAKVVHAN
ncbi:hypothetical protein C0991_004631, partial [Blastosporella zonata]